MWRPVLSIQVMLPALILCVTGAALPSYGQSDQAESRQETLLEQRRAKAEQLTPYVISKGEARVLWAEDTKLPNKIFEKGFRGFRPLLGGAPQGAGWFVGGLGYVNGIDREEWRFQINARTSTNRYLIADTKLELPTELSPFPIKLTLDASARDLRRINFFGVGNDSETQRIFYRIKDSWAGGTLAFAPSRMIEFSFDGAYYSIRPEDSDRHPTISDVLPPGELPGFETERTNYAVTGTKAILRLYDQEIPWVGALFKLEARRFESLGLGLNDFHRVIADVAVRVPLGYRNRILAAHFRTSHSIPEASEHEIPFYFMEGVGGSRTLRGYESDRFRDNRNLLLAVEYRWEVWTYLDFALFYDSGKVFPESNGMSFSDMHHGYGFGFRIHTPALRVLRLDFSHSVEGFRLYFYSGEALF